MKKDISIIPNESIGQRILFIHGQKVIIDADLAFFYGVSTKQLNQQIKRNSERFREDFVFQLTEEEKQKVVTNCDHLKKLKFSQYRPSAFTEYGVLMAANVLNSPKAIHVSVQIIRTFVRLRQMLSSNEVFAHKLSELEKKYDKQFKIVFEALRQILTPPEKPKRPFGFPVEEPKVPYTTRKKKL